MTSWIINGTNATDDIIGTALSPFTNLFQQIIGNGNVFYLVPIIALSLGIWYKTDEPVFASMFIIGVGGILGMGSLLAGVEDLGIMFTIFAAIGLTILIISLILERRG